MIKSAKKLNGVIGMTYCEALKRFRRDFKLSQQNVADKLGMQQPLYFRYEKGETVPALTFIIKMAKAFDVSADYLLGLRDTPKPLEVSAAEVQMAREFSKALEKYVKVSEVKT